jgi:hypothetical protein
MSGAFGLNTIVELMLQLIGFHMGDWLERMNIVLSSYRILATINSTSVLGLRGLCIQRITGVCQTASHFTAAGTLWGTGHISTRSQDWNHR